MCSVIPGMKTYRIERDNVTWTVSANVKEGECSQRIAPCYDIVKHADAFGWGKDDCAALQLALALLVDCVGVDTAIGTYAQFSKEVIAKIPRLQLYFELTDTHIYDWIKLHS